MIRPPSLSKALDPKKINKNGDRITTGKKNGANGVNCGIQITVFAVLFRNINTHQAPEVITLIQLTQENVQIYCFFFKIWSMVQKLALCFRKTGFS